MHKILLLALLSISILANPLDQTNFDFKDSISEKHEDDVLKFILSGSYLTVDNPELGTNITGFGGSFQAMYLLSDKFAIGGGAGTIMSEAGAGAASILNWAFTYSLTGRLKSTKSTYSLNGKQVLSGGNSLAEGLRAQFFLSQYYFNATKNTIPYAGIGGQIYYDKHIKSIGTNAIIGFRIDQLFNNEVGIMPMSLVFGILI